MLFKLVHRDTYARREHYEHYREQHCTVSITVPIDVTDLCPVLKQRQLKTHPTLLWLVSSVVNALQEFRMERDAQGRLGFYEVLHPVYTIMQEQTKTFSCLWTQFSSSFKEFHRAYCADVKHYADGSLAPQKDYPPNVFPISCIPWVDFTALHLSFKEQNLLPIFTIGKIAEHSGSMVMPLAIQVHHAVCDGYHIGQFVDRTPRAMDRPVTTKSPIPHALPGGLDAFCASSFQEQKSLLEWRCLRERVVSGFI
ncbi:MAG: chloramphenicol acetyltransferase [Holosporales bacterium]|jgi:chloramphenicol O-acetyltransferase type A|nr:chloramphenicol acetyltransferase [Holosporales bacterium]